jgi:methylthioribose-1-phosphate isomerase
MREDIPVTLVTDSCAAELMRRGLVNAVVVGADRVTANGDVANKIGTYSLAVLARHHGFPFIVAAPCSTLDLALPDGDAIEIEERDAGEIRDFRGSPLAPEGCEVFNPAFDITPAALVTALVTEKGVVRQPDRERIAQHMDTHHG